MRSSIRFRIDIPGEYKTAEARSWKALMHRCYNPKNNRYYSHGGRGITVCEHWHTYANFLEDMGRKPSTKHTVERKNNSLGYFLDNCIWADLFVQAKNKRNNIQIDYQGRTQPLKTWCRELGLHYRNVWCRHKKGWTPQEMFEYPFVRGCNDRRVYAKAA